MTSAEATMARNVLELTTPVLDRSRLPVHVTTDVRALVTLWNETTLLLA